MVVLQAAPDQIAQWAWSWEAIGTIGAVIVALALALRDAFRRRREQRARAKLAIIMLWPELRRYQATLKELSNHEVLKLKKLASDRSITLQRILGSLATEQDRVASMVRDLDAEDAERMARIIANVRHAYRHTVDLQMAAGAIGDQQFNAKARAVQKSIKEARSDLLPLIRKARLLMDKGR